MRSGTLASVRDLRPWRALFAIVFTGCTVPALDLGEREAIYGADDRREWHEVDAELRRTLAEGSVALMHSWALQSTGAGYRINAYSLGESRGLCSDQRFREQPTAAFCSGALVGPDLVMTAGHCVDSGCGDTRFVFGYRTDDGGSFSGEIASADVVGCREVVYYDDGLADFALVRLEHGVSRRPIPVSSRSYPGAGDRLVLAGYPSGIPLKVDEGGVVSNTGGETWFRGTVDAFGGNSGSPVLDTDGAIVGVLVAGAEDYGDRGGCSVALEYGGSGSGGSGETITNAVTMTARFCESASAEEVCDPASNVVVPICGDMLCEGDESTPSCPSDCPPTCGDMVCEGGETSATCPRDCPSEAVCGDGTCEADETRASCELDCGPMCGDMRCEDVERDICPIDCGAPASCGDGNCSAGEATTCAQDCPGGPACGDGYCDMAEVGACAADCSVCGDRVCDAGETCSRDCAPSVCGDGVCAADEPSSCSDCGSGPADTRLVGSGCRANGEGPAPTSLVLLFILVGRARARRGAHA